MGRCLTQHVACEIIDHWFGVENAGRFSNSHFRTLRQRNPASPAGEAPIDGSAGRSSPVSCQHAFYVSITRKRGVFHERMRHRDLSRHLLGTLAGNSFVCEPCPTSSTAAPSQRRRSVPGPLAEDERERVLRHHGFFGHTPVQGGLDRGALYVVDMYRFFLSSTRAGFDRAAREVAPRAGAELA